MIIATPTYSDVVSEYVVAQVADLTGTLLATWNAACRRLQPISILACVVYGVVLDHVVDWSYGQIGASPASTG